MQESGEKGGSKVSKRLKVLIMSLLVTIIRVVAFAGTVFAAGGPNAGDCPDCPDVDCPNPDCPRDGIGPVYQHGHGHQYQYRLGQG